MIDRLKKKKMRQAGIDLQCGPLWRDTMMMLFECFPICGIRYESEAPTDEEIEYIAAFAKQYLPDPPVVETDGLAKLGEGTDTLVLLKQKGQWFARRISWPLSPTWVALKNLSDLTVRSNLLTPNFGDFF